MSGKLLPVVLAVLIFAAGCGSGGAVDGSRGRNVLLIIIDTLRADHLESYGYSRETSPVMDSLAAGGTIWLNAISQAPWTLPSHASIWTGLSVRAHGTTHVGGIDGFDMKLDENLPLISSELSAAGITTLGFTTFVLLSEEFGFHRGFDHYDCEGSGEQTAEATFEKFIAWMEDHWRGESFFCVLHVYDVHAPYAPVAPFDTAFSDTGINGVDYWELTEDGSILNESMRDHLVDMYDGEILYVDHQVGVLLEELDRLNALDSTVVIITSDHGEEFLEHGGVGHGHALYQEQVRVPLIMAGPGIDQGAIYEDPVGLYDLMPTILTMYGIQVPEMTEGVDLLAGTSSDRPIPTGGVSPDRFFLAETPLDGFQSCAVIREEDKVIAYMGIDSLIQFDLGTDPEELLPMEPDSGMTMLVLHHWATPMLGTPEPLTEMTEEVNAMLRDLGYVR